MVGSSLVFNFIRKLIPKKTLSSWFIAKHRPHRTWVRSSTGRPLRWCSATYLIRRRMDGINDGMMFTKNRDGSPQKHGITSFAGLLIQYGLWYPMNYSYTPWTIVIGCLVGGWKKQPLKNMSSWVGMIIETRDFWKSKISETDVPNHQAVSMAKNKCRMIFYLSSGLGMSGKPVSQCSLPPAPKSTKVFGKNTGCSSHCYPPVNSQLRNIFF